MTLLPLYFVKTDDSILMIESIGSIQTPILKPTESGIK